MKYGRPSDTLWNTSAFALEQNDQLMLCGVHPATGTSQIFTVNNSCSQLLLGTVIKHSSLNTTTTYRIHSRYIISRKIYDKILPQKLGDDLSVGHKIKKFFSGAKIRNLQCTGNQPAHWQMSALIWTLTTASDHRCPSAQPLFPSQPAPMVCIVVQWPSWDGLLAHYALWTCNMSMCTAWTFQYKSSKTPATYTRVNDFRPHRDSLLGGRLIRGSDLYASIYSNN